MAGNNAYLREPHGGINDEQNNQHNTQNKQQNNQPRAPANYPRASAIQPQGPQYTGQSSHQAPPMAFSRSGLNRDSGLLNSDGPSGFDRNAGFGAENGGSAGRGGDSPADDDFAELNSVFAGFGGNQRNPNPAFNYGNGNGGGDYGTQHRGNGYGNGQAGGRQNPYTQDTGYGYGNGETPGHWHWNGNGSGAAPGHQHGNRNGNAGGGAGQRDFEECANCYYKGYPDRCNSNGQPHSRLNPCLMCQNSLDKKGNVLECGAKKGAVRFPSRGGKRGGGAAPRGGLSQRGRGSARGGPGYGQQAPPPDFLQMRQQITQEVREGLQQEIREDLRREFDEKLRQQKQEQEEKLRQQKQEQETAALRETVLRLEMQIANGNANGNANAMAERDRKRDEEVLFLKLALQFGTANANAPSQKYYHEQETSYPSNPGLQPNLGMDGARRSRGGRGRRGRGGIRGGAQIGHTAPPAPTARPDGARFLADRNANVRRRHPTLGTNDAQFNEPGNGQLTLVNRFQGMAVFDSELIDDDADFLSLERTNRGLARPPRR